MNVGEYIRHTASLPWDWGGADGVDCCTYQAGWVIECGHPDPMAFIRGSYDSELSALRRIKEGGGLIPLWQRGMTDAGVPEVETPRIGDVGIVRLPTDDELNEACAIFTGKRWVLRWTYGILSTPADALIVWRP